MATGLPPIFRDWGTSAAKELGLFFATAANPAMFQPLFPEKGVAKDACLLKKQSAPVSGG